MKRIVLTIIRSYQQLFSNGFLKLIFLGAGCRFQPTCSEYTYQAVEKYGTIRGLKLGFKRLFRCRPFSQGGSDPIE